MDVKIPNNQNLIIMRHYLSQEVRVMNELLVVFGGMTAHITRSECPTSNEVASKQELEDRKVHCSHLKFFLPFLLRSLRSMES